MKGRAEGGPPGLRKAASTRSWGMTRIAKTPTAPYNPFFGCGIIASAAIVFGGIIAWSLYSLNTQDKEIAKFTVGQPVKPVAVKVAGAELESLKQRLAAFGEEAKAAKPAKLALTVAELNTLTDLAPDTGYGHFGEMIAFTSAVEGKELVADVCFPMNKMRFWEGKRYAVGQATFGVVIVNETGPDIKLHALTVPGKEVNPGFVSTFSSLSLLAPYHKLEALAPVMKAVKSAKVTSTGVELSTTP